MTGTASHPSESEALIAAFCEERGIMDDRKKRFGIVGQGVLGVCDGTQGVQWNTWVDWRLANAPTGYVGVNLEGLTYDGWPVGRLIARELQAPELFAVIPHVIEPGFVEAIWFRDAWQFASRPVITEKMIGASPVTLDRLTSDEWKRMLLEAADCLGTGFRGRAKQIVTPKGGPKEFDVSPHLQFRVACRATDSHSISSWRTELKRTFALLGPLHEFASSRAVK